MIKHLLLLLLLPVAAFSQAQTPLTITQSAGSATGELRMQERRTNGQHYIGIRAPESIPTNVTWTMPSTDGTSGQALTTDGAGTLSWASAGGAGLPAVDTTAVVKGSGDATKLLRFEVDGFTTATTRVLTPQNASYTLAGTDLAQTFTAAQTFNSTLNAVSGLTVNGTLVISSSRDISNITSVAQHWVPYLSSYDLGSSVTRWGKLWASTFDFSGGGTFTGNVVLSGGSNTMSGTLAPGFDGLGSIGSASFRYGNLYAYTVNAYTAYAMGGTTVINSSRNLVGLNAIGQSLTFSAGSTYSIGTSTVYPLNVYANYVEPKTSLVMGSGTSVQGDLLPTSSLTYALGNSTWKWSALYTNNAFFYGSIQAPNGSLGQTTTVIVTDSSGSGTCTLVFSAGLKTGGTC